MYKFKPTFVSAGMKCCSTAGHCLVGGFGNHLGQAPAQSNYKQVKLFKDLLSFCSVQMQMNTHPLLRLSVVVCCPIWTTARNFIC